MKNINLAKIAAYIVYYTVCIIITFAIIFAMFAIPEFLLNIIGCGI